MIPRGVGKLKLSRSRSSWSSNSVKQNMRKVHLHAIDDQLKSHITKAEEQLAAQQQADAAQVQTQQPAVRKVTTTMSQPQQAAPSFIPRQLSSSRFYPFFIAGVVGWFGWSFFSMLRKQLSPAARRDRKINANMLLITELNKFLPGNADGLQFAAKQIKRKTGFTPVEIFRKYLWFLLRERKFDVEAVGDLVALKTAFGLSDDDVAEAVSERAKRIANEYGSASLYLDSAKLTEAGVQRVAAARSYFARLLYLTETEQLIGQESDAKELSDLRMIFGCTDTDVEKLRIVSLVDIDSMEASLSSTSASSKEESQ